jgi:hypothetical protein
VPVLTLALGIGASSLIFSLVYNGVLHPFPYRSADRLTTIVIEDKECPGRGGHSRYHLDEVAAFRKGNHTFEDILAYGLWYVVYTPANITEMLKGAGGLARKWAPAAPDNARFIGCAVRCVLCAPRRTALFKIPEIPRWTRISASKFEEFRV